MVNSTDDTLDMYAEYAIGAGVAGAATLVAGLILLLVFAILNFISPVLAVIGGLLFVGGSCGGMYFVYLEHQSE